MTNTGATGVVGRLVGFIIFLLGIFMLGVVFWQSWQIFLDPGVTRAPANASDTLVARLSALLVRLAFLLAMTIAASLIASKGITLFISAHHPAPAPAKRSRRAAQEHTEPEHHDAE